MITDYWIRFYAYLLLYNIVLRKICFIGYAVQVSTRAKRNSQTDVVAKATSWPKTGGRLAKNYSSSLACFTATRRRKDVA